MEVISSCQSKSLKAEIAYTQLAMSGIHTAAFATLELFIQTWGPIQTCVVLILAE